MPNEIKISRTQKRSSETRRKLFDTSIRLFLKDGFESTTVAAITEASDLGKGTFFKYFPTKESVLSELGKIIIKNVKIELNKNLKKLSACKQIETLIDQACAWHEKNIKLSRLVTRLVMSVPGGIHMDRPNQIVFIQILQELIKQGQLDGEIDKKINPKVAAQTIAGAYFMNIINWHENATVGQLRKQGRQFIQIIIKGMQV